MTGSQVKRFTQFGQVEMIHGGGSQFPWLSRKELSGCIHCLRFSIHMFFPGEAKMGQNECLKPCSRK